MRRAAIAKVSGLCVLCGAGAVLPGCIIVASKESDYGEIEAKKADAQYMAARAELERINLERHKLGLAPVEVPPPVNGHADPDAQKCEPTTPTSYP
jgi:hypothetical protein